MKDHDSGIIFCGFQYLQSQFCEGDYFCNSIRLVEALDLDEDIKYII